LSVPPDVAKAPRLLVIASTKAFPAEFQTWNVAPLVIAEYAPFERSNKPSLPSPS
jgi:hypothetical protein